MNGASKALFLLILIVGAAFFVNDYMAVYETGFTVTSVTTSPSYITNSMDLKTVNFLITTVFNAGGQSIVGTLTPSEMKYESGYETEWPLTIEASAVNEILDYPIINQPNLKINKYRLVILNTPLWNQHPACPDGPAKWEKYYVDSWINLQKYCIYEDDVGTMGYLNNPTVGFNSKITLTADGKSIAKDISNIQQSVSFYDGSTLRATAQWTGSLVTGNPYPSQDLYVGTYLTGGNGWHIADKNKEVQYNSIRSTTRAIFDSIDAGTNICPNRDTCSANIDSYVNNLNIATNSLTTGAEPGIGDAQQIIDSSSLSDSDLRITMDRRFANPQVVFKVNADWIGIKFGVGQPRIISVNCPTFASGDDEGVCNVEFKNIGTATGTFVASFTSTSSFNQQYSFTPVTLGVGESITSQLFISHGVEDVLTATGTVKVYDLNDPSMFDTKTVTVTMTEPKTCQPGAERVVGQSIFKCNDEGTGEYLLLTCEEGTVPGLNDAKTNLECRDVTGVTPGIGGSIFDWFDGILDSIFGDEFGVDDIIPLIITIIMVLVILYLLFLTLPILIPLIGKTLLGLLIGRK